MMATAYGEVLRARGAADAQIETAIRCIRALETGLREQGTELAAAGKKDIGRYAARMVANGTNTPENFDTLIGYTLWRGLRPQYVALLELVDCHNAMETLRSIIAKRHGTEICGQIFREPLPPLGTAEPERYTHTKTITGRMNAVLSPADSRAAWRTVRHGIADQFWREQDAKERERYAGCQSVGVFLNLKRQERNQHLTELHEKGELWYTMELTDEVYDFLTGEVHMQMGEKDGRKGIVVTKVPYQPGRYLQETNETLKRYFACHCPLIREAILRGEPVSPDVCYCSLGHASHFLAGMGLSHLEGEVMESAVRGDMRCRFIFYLPEDAQEA